MRACVRARLYIALINQSAGLPLVICCLEDVNMPGHLIKRSALVRLWPLRVRLNILPWTVITAGGWGGLYSSCVSCLDLK